MSKPYGKANWFNMIFIGVNTLIALIAGPWYVSRHGFSPGLLALTIFYIFATGLSITVGYHRLFAHVTYKANGLVQFLLLFLLAAPFEASTGMMQHLRFLLPMIPSTGLLRDLMARDLGLDWPTFGLALLNGIAYLAAGLWVFRWAEKTAKKRGSLGGY